MKRLCKVLGTVPVTEWKVAVSSNDNNRNNRGAIPSQSSEGPVAGSDQAEARWPRAGSEWNRRGPQGPSRASDLSAMWLPGHYQGQEDPVC